MRIAFNGATFHRHWTRLTSRAAGCQRAERHRHGLFLTQFGVILYVMTHWSARQLFALVLAVFIAAGMSLSVAQASSMSAQIATMTEMGMSAEGGCQDCPDQPGDSGMKAMNCGVACAAPVFAVLPASVLIPTSERAACFAVDDSLLRGRALLPDPYPPRTSDIG